MVSSIGSAGTSGYNPLQQVMRQLQQKNDKNDDGELNTDEIGSLLQGLPGQSGDTSQMATQLVASLDSDGDGAVSASEFDAGFKKLSADMQSQMLALQEGDDNGPAAKPAGHHHGGGHHHVSSATDDDDDDDTTDDDLLSLLDPGNGTASAEAASEQKAEADPLQSFLRQLGSYARMQDYQSQASGTVSFSA